MVCLTDWMKWLTDLYKQSTLFHSGLFVSYLYCIHTSSIRVTFRGPDSEFLFIEMGMLKFYDWLIDSGVGIMFWITKQTRTELIRAHTSAKSKLSPLISMKQTPSKNAQGCGYDSVAT